MSIQKISKILIANRSEIARRIIRTAKTMSIKTVAIYTTSDQDALHISEASEAYWCSSEKIDGYLDPKQIIDIALESGCNAIHPGYGFLSENPIFASLVKKAGLIFIGPSPEVLELAGDKRKAKEEAIKCNIPTTPSITLNNILDNELLSADKFIKQHGTPIVVKAAFGGGGKGLRVIQDSKDAKKLITAASQEADKLFSSGQVFIETYVENARHIEVQFLASQDNCVRTLGTRDCSLQRKHQKIIEEAPAFNLSTELNDRLCSYATKLAQSIGYTGIGTAEFLVKNQSVYFLEINARIQVEHPVTEKIFDLDLVKCQILIAEGKSLNEILPPNLETVGVAIEARLCAENSRQNAKSQTGWISSIDYPLNSESLRIDSAFDKTGTISYHYDSMIGKLISYAPTRAEAITKLSTAISKTKICGVLTNTEYLISALNSQEFITGNIHTQIISDVYPPKIEDPNIAILSIAWDILRNYRSETLQNVFNQNIHQSLPGRNLEILINGEQVDSIIVFTTSDSGNITLKHNFLLYEFKIQRLNTTTLLIKLYDKDSLVIQDLIESKIQGSEIFLYSSRGAFKIERKLGVNAISNANHKLQIFSPLPGRILKINTSVGSTVQKDDLLITIESMKMEHQIFATCQACVDSILTFEGSAVSKDQLLIQLKN